MISARCSILTTTAVTINPVFKSPVEAVVCDRRADPVRALLECRRAVFHADRIADGLHHLKVVHAVAETDGVANLRAEVVDNAAHALALVKVMAHNFTVHAAVRRDILDDKVKVLLEQALALFELRGLPRHDHDFMNRLSRIFFHRANTEALGERLAPSLDLGVAALGAVEKIL